MDYFMGAWPEAYAGSSTDVELNLDVIGSGSVMSLAKDTDGLPTAGAVTVTSGRRLQDAGPTNMQFTIGTDIGAESILEMFELRRAESLVRFLEAENRSGTEQYDEWLKIMFGNDPNFRYARPVFLGGGRTTINISEVLSTAETYDYTGNDLTTQQTLNPQGSQVGHALASSGGETINFTAQEHGMLMTVLVIKPSLQYGGGQLERFWTKSDRTEFYNYHFENIGDQAIYNCEFNYIEGSGGSANMDTWAYSTRFEEYKQKQSIVCGDYLKSGLDAWHMAIITDPSDGGADAFSNTLHQIRPGDDQNLRIFADQSEEFDEIWLNVYNDVQVQLPMKKVAIPK